MWRWVCLVGCLLAGASPARADPPWSSPETVPGVTGPARVAFAVGGNGLLGYPTSGGLVFAALSPAGGLGAPMDASSNAGPFALSADGVSRFLVAQRDPTPTAAGPLRVGH